ncbi:uncharacterized protein LOC111338336 isoform X2 [Stylophora pistillata]|uniref:uncharacterized protein LOC111338336 isoform X2 n=1 Tax=Stylophora pistillata TaxID=50429 RepID=UPI000C042108|nr:uncharacterized protein LOC111338336 isoform X2 [Stylophora pistillata]
MDILLPLMSLVFAFVAGSTSGKSTKHRHSPIKKFLSGKRSDLPWWNIPNTRDLKKARAGRRSQGPSYPFSNQYAAYAPSFAPSPPSIYPSAYPSPPSFSYPPLSSYPAPPPYYYPPPSYPSPASYPSPYPSSLPGSSLPTNAQAQQLSYSTSQSNVYANDQYQQQQISFPSQVNPGKAASMGNSAAYLMISGSKEKPSNDAKKPKAKPTPPDRTEKFEIKGRFFKSIGCWADSTKIRAMDSLEGRSSRLKQPYKTRVNALMKCAEVADEQDLKIFGLQNGGQCFGGKNAENTYRKYGQSTECAGDGEGGPWSNEVYSFLDEDDQPLVKPPKIMDNNNGSTNGTSTACRNPCVNNANTVCPNRCANNSSSSSTNTTCSMPPPGSASAGQICGWGCPIPIPGCNVTGTNSTLNGTGAPAKVNQTAPAGCGTVGAIPCKPSPVVGCASMGGGGNPCPPQGMPMGNPTCGGGVPMGGAPCGSHGITIDSGCIQIGGAPCPAPAQGMAPGGCIDMGAGCVIEGKLTEGYPNITNATAGGNPCHPYGNTTGGCGSVIPSGVGPSGPNGTIPSNGTTLGQISGKPPPSAPKCKAKADLGFIIDGSGSIEKNGPGTFKKVLSFVKDLTRSFDVSKEGTHVGVIVYSDEPKVVSGFDQHYNQSEVIAAIEGIQYPNGGTNTGKALLKAKEALFAASARSGVPNIACVLTDGKSKDNIGAPAQKLRESGVTVISIGMGTDYDLEQLREIATDPDSQHMFKAEFNSLWSLVDSIVDTGCKAAGGTIQLPPPQSIIKGSPPPAVETKCQAKVDIAFLLDGSGSIDFQQPGNFKKCLGFLKNFVLSFNIAKDGTHVGVVLFSKTAEVMFNFEKYLDSKSMVEAIDKIPYPAKSTYTGIGLDLVRTGLFENSARQGVRDILIVMTDGASQDSIEDPSKKLRDMGVTIFCFGVGTQYKKDQLDEMATDPDSKHVLTGGFDDLDQILPKIKKMACDGAGGSLSQIPSKGVQTKLNLGFIIECSSSIERNGQGTFAKVLKFVKDLAGSFDISKEGTHIGVTAYSDEAKIVLGLDQYYSQSEVIAAIDRIQYLGGGTMTGKALLLAKDALFAASARSGVPNIACVLTASRSTDDVGSSAQMLKGSGVTCISIGMGTDYDLGQLQAIATDPDSQFMFKAGFNALGSLVSPVVASCRKASSGAVTGPLQPPASGTKCQAKVDIAFLLDGSGSIGKENFKKCLRFLRNFVQSFNIAKDGTHVGVVLFSKTAEVVFSFEKYLDSKSMVEAIDKITYPAKSTYTGIGLDLVRTGLFENSARQGVRDVLIVMTDGASQDYIEDPSKKLRDMGVTIFCFGIGTQYKKDQLDAMATDPDATHVITGDFDDLDQILPKIKKMACDGAGGSLAQTPSIGGRIIGGSSTGGAGVITGGGSSSTGGGSSTGGSVGVTGGSSTGGSGVITGGGSSSSGGDCKAKADLGFIIDGSGSIESNGQGTFTKILSFVQDLTRRFAVSSEGTHIGLVVFDDDAKVVSGFDQHYTQSEVIAVIGGIQYPGGGTKIGKALLKAKEALFDASARSGVPNIACVLAGSKSTDGISAPAQKLRDSGVTVISIGMGTKYCSKQLGEIATDPNSQHMFKTEFDALWSLVGSVADTCCKAAGGSFQASRGGSSSFGGGSYSQGVNGGSTTGGSSVITGGGSSSTGGGSSSQGVSGGLTTRGSSVITGGGSSTTGGSSSMSVTGGSIGSTVGGGSSISIKGGGSTSSSGASSSRIMTIKGGSSSSGSQVVASGKRLVKIGKVVLTPKQGDPVDVTDVWGTEDNLVKDVISGSTSAKVRPVALFPLNERYEARDVIGGNLAGVKSYVKTAQGPYKKEGGSLSFLGTPDSFIEFPNNGKLDTKDSLSILAWIYPEKAGPIFNFRRDGWGTNLWLAQPRKLFAHFVHRGNRELIPPLQSTKVAPNRWNFIGATYDHRTGDAGLWINGKFEDFKHIGRIRLATNYPIRMGARVGDKRNYRGRIACLQIYDKSLTSKQIDNAKNSCKFYIRQQKRN